ncbi:hypothetical protein TB2_040849 [Malus domestica]
MRQLEPWQSLRQNPGQQIRYLSSKSKSTESARTLEWYGEGVLGVRGGETSVTSELGEHGDSYANAASLDGRGE